MRTVREKRARNLGCFWTIKFGPFWKKYVTVLSSASHCKRIHYLASCNLVWSTLAAQIFLQDRWQMLMVPLGNLGFLSSIVSSTQKPPRWSQKSAPGEWNQYSVPTLTWLGEGDGHGSVDAGSAFGRQSSSGSCQPGPNTCWEKFVVQTKLQDTVSIHIRFPARTCTVIIVVGHGIQHGHTARLTGIIQRRHHAC